MCQWERQLQSVSTPQCTKQELHIRCMQARGLATSLGVKNANAYEIFQFQSQSETLANSKRSIAMLLFSFIFCCLLPFNETTMTHELVFFLLLCSSQQFSQISQISIARELLLISLSFRVNHSPRVAASVTSTLFAFCFCPPKINVLRSIQCTKNK